jgi:hypothetical protein
MLGALALPGLARAAKPGAGGPARALVVALAVAPVLLPFAASFAGPPVYLTRAAIAASLALAVLAAAGWAALGARARLAAALLVVAACVPPLADLHTRTYKEPWREGVRWLEHEARAGDLVLVTAPWYRDGVFAYYQSRRDLPVRRVPGHEGPVAPDDIALLRDLLARHPRVWLVRARADDPQGLLPAALAAGRELVAHREWRVTPAGLTRVREVGAFEMFCYAAPAASAPESSTRPPALKP